MKQEKIGLLRKSVNQTADGRFKGRVDMIDSVTKKRIHFVRSKDSYDTMEEACGAAKRLEEDWATN